MRRLLPFKGHEGRFQCHSGWQGREGWDQTNGNLFWQVVFWISISWMIWICFLDVFFRLIFLEARPWPASAPKRFTHLPVTCGQNFGKIQILVARLVGLPVAEVLELCGFMLIGKFRNPNTMQDFNLCDVNPLALVIHSLHCQGKFGTGTYQLIILTTWHGLITENI